MCSSETDPVRDHHETWRLENRDRTLVIAVGAREVRFTIVALDRRRLKLRVREVRAISGP